MPPSAPRISVIVPALNESDCIAETLAAIPQSPDIEIIVADGGSQDDTVALSEAAGATVVAAPPGRAVQMNAGAEAAAGEILLFLHADTRLPPEFPEAVQGVFSDGRVVLGAFLLRIDAERPASLRCIETVANWRSRFLHLPYGDQALFIRAEQFRALGGYAPLPIMEDVEFLRRAKRLGRIAILPLAACTSARRWKRLGICRTTLLNQLTCGAYFLGVSPDRLARWYGRESR